MKIDYLSDPIKEYVDGLPKVTSQEELVNFLHSYNLIAHDALLVALRKDFDFKEFMTGLRKERKRKFAGNEWAKKYTPILLPILMFEVTKIADDFKAPWGTAYIQMTRYGYIKKKNGVASLTEKWHTERSKQSV